MLDRTPVVSELVAITEAGTRVLVVIADRTSGRLFDVLARDVGIRFKGAEKTNVEEYCVSEGWIRVAAGKALDRFGNPLTIKLTGQVEPYFKNAKPD